MDEHLRGRSVPAMAAIFNLNHNAGYVHWHFFQMSWPNLIVIIAMLVVFVLAIAIPFPRAHAPSEERP
jgi:hypothetical protein